MNDIITKRLCLGAGCIVLFVNERERNKSYLEIEIDEISSNASIHIDRTQIKKLKDFLNEFIGDENDK